MSRAVSRRAFVVGAGAWLFSARRPRAAHSDLSRLETQEPMVAMTFDDGPDPEYTPEVLDALRRFDARATFFVVGVNAQAHPDLVRRQLGEGHGLGNHTFDHPFMHDLDATRLRAAIDDAAAVLARFGPPPPRLFRPPHGDLRGAALSVARATGHRTVMWDLCLEHFLRHSGVALGTESLLDRVRPGSIILAHDGGRIVTRANPVLDRHPTVAALPLLLEGLAGKGMRVVDLGTLLRG